MTERGGHEEAVQRHLERFGVDVHAREGFGHGGGILGGRLWRNTCNDGSNGLLEERKSRCDVRQYMNTC